MSYPSLQKDPNYEQFSGAATVLVGSCSALAPLTSASFTVNGAVSAGATTITYSATSGLTVDKTNKLWNIAITSTGEILLIIDDDTIDTLTVVKGVAGDLAIQCVGCDNTLTYDMAIPDAEVVSVIGEMYQINDGTNWFAFDTLGDLSIARSGDLFIPRGNLTGALGALTQEMDIQITVPFLDALKPELKRYIDKGGVVFFPDPANAGVYSSQMNSIEGIDVASIPLMVVPVRESNTCANKNDDDEALLHEAYFYPSARPNQSEDLTFSKGTQRVCTRMFTATYNTIFRTQGFQSWFPFRRAHYPSDA